VPLLTVAHAIDIAAICARTFLADADVDVFTVLSGVV